MEDFGTYNIASFITPATPLKINLNMGWEYVRIINNSPYLLNVNFGGAFNLTLPEMYLEDIRIPSQGPVWITITPTTNLGNIIQAISYTISINAFSKGELTNPQAQPLTQQAVNTTASGKPVFSANADFSNTATTGQSLNIFNPITSGAILIIYQVTIYTNDPGFPGANLFEFIGADNNFANPVNIVSHQVSSNPPVSVAHATSQDSASTPPGTVAEVIRCQQFAANNMPIFPDDNKLYPGGNFTINLAGTASGKIVHLTVKWTESVIVPPVLVTGAKAVASSIDNEGNPVGTSIIKAGITGVGTPIQIFNDGSSAWLVDASGVLHKVITTNLAANFLQLGQAGDNTEVLGTIVADQGINVGTIRDNVIATVAALIASGGLITVQQLLTLIAGLKLTGSTSPAIDASGVSGAVVLKLLAGSLSRVWVSGALSIAVAGTSVSHGLGVIPDFVVGTLDEGSAGTGVIGINYGTMSSTTFTAFVTPASSCRFIAIKQ